MKYTAVEYAFHGELVLHLRGHDVGNCLTRMHEAGIPLRSVKVRESSGQCAVCLRDFDSVYRICRTSKVRFRIVHRRGLPFWRKRLWRRKMFAVGALFFVCVIYTMSSMIWRVDVTGPKDEDGMGEIRDAARATGIFVGQRKTEMADPVTLQQNLLSHAPNFVWVGVRTVGSVTTIQAIPKVKDIPSTVSVPQNIIASRPAVIQSVAATRGRVVVKKNQYVRPGDVLISGNLTEGRPSVPASGQVMGEVWYTTKVSVPLQVVQGELTGQKVTRDYLYIGPLKIRVWGFEEPHFSASYERDKGTDWAIGKFILPVQWQKVQLYEATQSTEIRSVTQAKTAALTLAERDVLTQMRTDGRILGQSVLHEQLQHGTLYETVLTRVSQNIGVPSVIPTMPQGQPEAGKKKPGE